MTLYCKIHFPVHNNYVRCLYVVGILVAFTSETKSRKAKVAILPYRQTAKHDLFYQLDTLTRPAKQAVPREIQNYPHWLPLLDEGRVPISRKARLACLEFKLKSTYLHYLHYLLARLIIIPDIYVTYL